MTIKKFIFYGIAFCTIFVGCRKDKTPKVGVPELSTTTVTDITSSTAMAGGNITSSGGEVVTIAGICWSATNQNPLISDDTTRSNAVDGAFTTMLKNLNPSTTYYVRAYAMNRIGTGYGNVVTFNTGNAAPFATAVNISGTAKGDELLTGNYTYNDAEQDEELESVFQWYVANDATGTGEAPIDGATEKTFRIQSAQEGRYIRFGVAPKAATGTQNGQEVKSSFVGAVGEATTVTFIYNEAEVTYGIINGPSGRKWLDRNLGAAIAARSISDYEAYGDLFQWGRLADGHQIISRTASSATGVTGITSTVAPFETSAENVPSTNKFIINKALASGADWRIPQESNLWQGADGINNPCPNGWRIPTKDEWLAEAFSSGNDAYNKLKLTTNGMREYSTGNFVYPEYGFYWTSTVEDSDPNNKFSYYFYMDAGTFDNYTTNRSSGVSVRCIKN